MKSSTSTTEKLMALKLRKLQDKMIHRNLNGKTRYFNLVIGDDLIKEIKKIAKDKKISTSHYICNSLIDEKGDLRE